jgi:hypothetical protein|tara:strand:- start:552 stop:941 length:390 start_codon:yes stop_codon:yes gene_type:complete
MPKINLITPPDKLYNDNMSILIVFPSDIVKTELQSVLSKINYDVNLYLYEPDEPNYEWLLSLIKSCDISIIDCDNLDDYTKKIESYLISKKNVFWLTNGDVMQYNYISNSRVYDLNWLIGEIEKYESTE